MDNTDADYIVMDYDVMASHMYDEYCRAAGGLTYDGKPLPSWAGIGEGRQKCWIAAATAAEDYMSDFME